jgi:hypothetical protein
MTVNRRRPAWLSILVASVASALSFSLPGLAVLPARAQNSPTLQGTVTNNVPATALSRNDLATKHQIDEEDDQHDGNDAAIDGAVRAENVAHDYHLDPDTGLVSQDGNHFYSDIDLHGVYDSEGNDVTRQFFNELMKNPQYRDGPLQDLIQHYPQDWWQFRNNPAVTGTNYGHQVGGGKTATAYLPDSTVRLDSIAQTRALCAENHINFSWLYPTTDRAVIDAAARVQVRRN